jgi:3',5'-cyclic AMP phosphodiesterase CpdA
MATIFHNPISRRHFLKTTLASAATVVTLGGCGSVNLFGGRAKQPCVRWAFLADAHIPANPDEEYRGFYPCRNLRQAVEEVISAQLEGVTIAGDLARLEGKPGDYETLKGLLTPLAQRSPIFMALGNHDDRDNFFKAFNNPPGERATIKGKHITIINAPAIRMIVLDSLLFVNKTSGLLGKAQRQWLGDYLAACDRTPTILCFHHTMADRDGDLLDVPRLFEMIKPVRKVKAIIYGHSHEYRFTKFDGIHLINVPATGYCFGKGQPVGWVEARLTPKLGQFTLRAIAADTTKDMAVTELIWRT